MAKCFKIELCRKGDKGHGLEINLMYIALCISYPTESINFIFGFLPFGDTKLAAESSTCMNVCKCACHENEMRLANQ